MHVQFYRFNSFFFNGYIYDKLITTLIVDKVTVIVDTVTVIVDTVTVIC